MANREPGFYWIVPVLDVDCDEEDFEWMNSTQPAYWDGTRWAMLNSEDRQWETRWVGDKILPPL